MTSFIHFRLQEVAAKRKKKMSLGGRFHGHELFDEDTGERLRIIPLRVVDRFYHQKDPRLTNTDEPRKRPPSMTTTKRKVVDETVIKRINNYLAAAVVV